MPVLSILTPVHAGALQYLPQAYRSLDQQEMPDGWSWEWCLQEDGPGVGAAAALPRDDPRIRIRTSWKGGPHVARTMALAHSTGTVVKSFDADDEFPEGALLRDLAVLIEHPEVGWVTSAAVHLFDDGSYRESPLGYPPGGPLPPGAEYAFWQEHRRPQVHPTTLCARRRLVTMLGGWMALPASGDTGLLLGLEAVARGWFLAEPGLVYRRHAGQRTAHPEHSHGDEWRARMSLIGERAAALHAWEDRTGTPAHGGDDGQALFLRVE